MTVQAQAEAAMRAATQGKASARATLIQKLGMTAKVLEGNPQVSDQMLRAISFSARPSGGSKPLALLAPSGLTAQAFADGTVKLAYQKNSKPTVNMMIETSVDGENWTFLKNTTKSSYLASGFKPGVPAWFRVTATNSTLNSPASDSASIYAPVQLRLEEGGAQRAA